MRMVRFFDILNTPIAVLGLSIVVVVVNVFVYFDYYSKDANPPAYRAYGAFGDDPRKNGASGTQREDATRGDAYRENAALNHPSEHDPHRSERYCERYLLSLSVVLGNTPSAERSFAFNRAT